MADGTAPPARSFRIPTGPSTYKRAIGSDSILAEQAPVVGAAAEASPVGTASVPVVGAQLTPRMGTLCIHRYLTPVAAIKSRRFWPPIGTSQPILPQTSASRIPYLAGRMGLLDRAAQFLWVRAA